MLEFLESKRWYVGSSSQDVQQIALKGRSGKCLGKNSAT